MQVPHTAAICMLYGMKDGIGAILFWLTIMMLLFKNFPQDEPIIIIIFDNRQIELHYHTHHHQYVIHRDLAIFAIWWAATKMMSCSKQISAKDEIIHRKKRSECSLHSRFSCRTSNIRFLYYYFIFCTVLSFSKELCHFGIIKTTTTTTKTSLFVVSNVVCC